MESPQTSCGLGFSFFQKTMKIKTFVGHNFPTVSEAYTFLDGFTHLIRIVHDIVNNKYHAIIPIEAGYRFLLSANTLSGAKRACNNQFNDGYSPLSFFDAKDAPKKEPSEYQKKKMSFQEILEN